MVPLAHKNVAHKLDSTTLRKIKDLQQREISAVLCFITHRSGLYRCTDWGTPIGSWNMLKPLALIGGVLAVVMHEVNKCV